MSNNIADKKMNNCFYINKNQKAFANDCLNKDVLVEFWHNCSFQFSKIDLSTINEFEFYIGNAKKPSLKSGEYAINVEENGVYVVAKGEKELIRAFVTLAQKMSMDYDGNVKIDVCQIEEEPKVKVQMAHFCIFPETKLYELEKFVRLCGALKYSHVIVEFWGMLKYDCLKELAWEHAFSKDQIRPIIKIANDFGMEVIPMFNHWGHASASRFCRGKHVVLDQNLSLQKYFSETGWCWEYKNPEVRKLHSQIREELIELCGNGEYFHIGCDEAWGFDFSKESMTEFCDYVNSVSEELCKMGRRAIIWGDMFVYKREEFNPKNSYYAFSRSLETEKFFLEHLDKRMVIGDWQYTCPCYPVETSKIFVDAGFDVLICPWDRGWKQIKACVDTAMDGLYGIMHTTWHTINNGYPYLNYVSERVWGVKEAEDLEDVHTYQYCKTATVLRKAYSINGNYEKTGFGEKQI